jgi:hypothetical protein
MTRFELCAYAERWFIRDVSFQHPRYTLILGGHDTTEKAVEIFNADWRQALHTMWAEHPRDLISR